MTSETRVAVLAVLVLAAVLSGAAAGATAPAPNASNAGTAAATAQSGEAYAGTHVSFRTSGNALTNYSVDGRAVLSNVSVEPKSEHGARTGLDLGVDLSAVTDVAGVDLSLDASTRASATVTTGSSASMTAHDSERGILTVHAGEDGHYAELEVASGGEASSEGDDRVVVDSGNRTGSVVVAGEGSVAVNEDGDVTADLAENATLVFRSYEGERSQSDREAERLIAEGTATAEVYAEEQDGELVSGAATYAEDVTVDASSEGQQRVSFAVDRARSEGTVVTTSLSESAVGTVESADDVSVTVDGQAAAQASSYSELEGGIGNDPRYMVASSGQASASSQVLVAVDHFSERQVTVQNDGGSGSGSDGGSGSGDDGGDGGSSDGSSDGTAGVGSSDDGSGNGTPGFGLGAALLALCSAVAARLRR